MPLLVQSAAVASAHASTPEAIISLTFDDSDLDQFTNAFPLLQQYGMTGTFYTISGYIGVNSGYMTLSDLQALYNSGNEIGGHTVLHPDLTQITTGEATREICDGRNTLLNWGFPVTDFAYPYGDYNSQVEQIVQQCGYNSARADSNIASPYGCQTGCPDSNSLPLADPYAAQAPASIQDTWSLSDIESLVTEAESAGGWQPIIFHHICENDCDQYSVTPEIFGAFLAWLQTQPVSVENVNQVIGGSVSPAVSAPSVPPAPAGTNGVVNPSLETPDQYNTGFPYCWTSSTSGTNTAAFAETSNAHSGSTAESITVTNYSSGDAKLLIKQDLGECAPSAVPGDEYLASAWYQSTAPTRFVIYYRDSNGGWHYWTQSPQYPASSSWTQATWATPAVPAAATGLSFGLDIAANGTLTTDDYSLEDTGGPPTPPTVSLTAPSSGSTLTGQVTFSATASSVVGIAGVAFQVDGVTVATSTSSPYTATWDSSTVGDGPVTVTATATDISGLQTTTASQADVVSNAANRGGSLIANGTLAANSGGGTTPDCWHEGGTGTFTPAWSYNTSGGPPGGGDSETVSISSYTSGDAVLDVVQNSSACTPGVTPGQKYTLSAWYQSTVPTYILVWYLNSSGNWVYWTQSPAFAASSGWTQAGWVTPAVPAGATQLSFGLDLDAAGTLTTGDYTMLAGSPNQPTVSLTGPSSGSTLSGQVTFTANASSQLGISAVNFLVNGVVVATSTSSPYSATWNSGNVSDGPVTVTAQAVDLAGGTATTAGQSDTISNAPNQAGNLLGNYMLQTNTSGGSTPYCWHEGGTGTSSYTWNYNVNNIPPGGGNSETLAISSYTSGDRLLDITQDTSACSPRVTPGQTYTLGAWYESTAPTNIIVYYLNASGSWVYWTQGPAIPASSNWAPAAYTTPAVPSGATALSFGVGLGAVGTLTTGDYSMIAGSPSPPAVLLTGPSSGSTLSGQVTFTANATSQIGISAVNFLVNGVVVATSTSAPYSATWNSANVSDGPVTVTAQAVDAAGNKATSTGQSDTIANAPNQGGNLLGNNELQVNTSGGSTPYCWHEGGTGTSTYSWSYNTGNNPPGGGNSETVTISSYTSGDRILTTTQDTSACSPRVTPGQTYTLGASYESTAATNIIVYYLNSSGSWVYWTQSKAIPASASWSSATFTTPAVPAGATAVSFGIGLGAAGTLTTGDYTMTSG